MKDINDKINENLSPQHVTIFNKVLYNCLYDRSWCRSHKIDYVNPDCLKAKEILYKEQFENKTSKEIEKNLSHYHFNERPHMSFFEALRNLVSKV